MTGYQHATRILSVQLFLFFNPLGDTVLYVAGLNPIPAFPGGNIVIGYELCGMFLSLKSWIIVHSY